MAYETPVCDFGWNAVDFDLLATDGKRYTLADIQGDKGTLIVFMCNHCPYVKSIIDRLIRDAHDLKALGIGVAAICVNDAADYPEDSFENMALWAQDKSFPFPYLHDPSQQIGRDFGAVCTPDFFGFNAKNELQYRGRLDESGRQAVPDARRDLYKAMTQIAETGQGPTEQIPSMGCSIKWLADDAA
jgi:peroxiredoxin